MAQALLRTTNLQCMSVVAARACPCAQRPGWVLWEEEGWRVRVLLEWQRLVNGGRVMAKRSGTVGMMGAHLRRPSGNVCPCHWRRERVLPCNSPDRCLGLQTTVSLNS